MLKYLEPGTVVNCLVKQGIDFLGVKQHLMTKEAIYNDENLFFL